MPRPTTKATLLSNGEKRFQLLLTSIEALDKTEREQTFPAQYLNRNIRDVIAHVHHWHLLFLEWYKIGMKGKKPEMPAPGYTWQTTPELNKEINVLYQNKSLAQAIKLIKSSHGKVQKVIDKHSEEELFTKKKYGWTGSTSMGAYLVSCTWSHYEWARKLIKKGLK